MMPAKKQDEERLPLLPEAGSDFDESDATLNFMRNASENQGRIRQWRWMDSCFPIQGDLSG